MGTVGFRATAARRAEDQERTHAQVVRRYGYARGAKAEGGASS